LDKVLKGQVDPLHHVLKHLGVNVFVLRPLWLEGHQSELLTVVIGLFSGFGDADHERTGIDWAAVHQTPLLRGGL